MYHSASQTKPRDDAGDFDPIDPSVYMLALPKSRSMHWNWFIFAVLTATGLAIGLVILGNFF